MSWVAVAIAGGAVIGAVGSNMAAGTQAAGQQQAASTQLGMFNTINQQEQPFIQGGYGALNQLMYGLGISPTTASGQTPSSAATGGGYQTLPGGGTTSSGWMPTPGGGVQQILTDGTGGGTGAPGGGATTLPSGVIGGSTGGPTPQSGFQPRPGSTLPGTGITATPTGGLPAGGTGGSGMRMGQLTSSFTPQDFLNNVDPGYGFQLATGGQAIRNQDTPSVGALSGPALKDLMSFNQGMASTGYQNAFNRFQTTNNAIFSRLSGIAGLGQNAASNVGTSGTQLGTGIAEAQAAVAGSQAGGIVGATKAIGGSSIPLAYLMSGQQQGGGGGGGDGFNFSNLPVNTIGQPGQAGN